ncbi:MAG: NAD+ synthase [Desulfobacterales bacterium]|nr:MAG: NAD+ synthase [Desulfobacterales bacterium]
MKIAIAQINPIIGDFNYNFNRIKQFAEQALAHAYDLVVFSELVVPGYPPRDLLENREFVEANLACLDKLVDCIHGIGVICGYVANNPADDGIPLFNSAALFEDGKILYQVNKRLLPTYDVFDESRYFEPGQQCSTYSYKGHKIGLTICEDVWTDRELFKRIRYHMDPVELLVNDGADILINTSASPFHVGKIAFRWNMHAAIAKKYQIPFIFANQVGGNDSVLFDGNSAAYDPHGNIVAQARDFEEDLIVFDLKNVSGDMRPTAQSDTQSILNALVMGTRDYVTKCGFSKVVVGLSGGIDSAVTVSIAVRALGKQNVSTVFMPSKYTSKNNFEDTQMLAENLDIDYEIIPIDGMFQEFLTYLSPDFKEDDPGITEQNIQARIRGTILMGISNREGRLVLSTGNKSELAVGYCTLYGDMNGGLAVISDVPKTVVYDIAYLLNAEKEIIPARILQKAPSAELKPGQEDQDDLPAYDILDSILKGYIEDLKGIDELVAMGFERKLVEDIISRIHRNEHKRHQAAPGLKVTSKAFGYGRRYPLAQRYVPNSFAAPNQKKSDKSA